jgi:hypothetical protein
MLVIFSAPGGGKSRFLDILADYVRKMDASTRSCLYGSVVLAISYNGATGTSPTVDEDLDLSPGFGLAARILWSYFAEQGVTEFENFCFMLLEKIPHLSPALALNAVVKHRTSVAAATTTLSSPVGNLAERSATGQGRCTVAGKSMATRVLLLVDELIKSEDVAEGCSLKIL